MHFNNLAMMNFNKIIKINTIEEFTERAGFPPSNHPLIAINRMTDVVRPISLDKSVQLNLYSISMKDGSQCTLRYGWREYDFKRGVLNFFAPGQVKSWEKTEDEGVVEVGENPFTWGWLLVFHPDFIRKYPLGRKVSKLKLFSYETNEALHMSDEERLIIEGIMKNIQNECKRSIDLHCQDIIVSQLDVLLNYAERFYTRQFITRNSIETDIMTRFQSILHKHFEMDKDKLITAKEIASELAMSTHYLSDMLRSLTGMNTQQHIHAYIIETAKSMLLTTSLSVNEIAYSLGFEYPQYFNRLFKSKTGQTPVEFRIAN